MSNEAINLLREVRAYNLGVGVYDFSTLPDDQRANEAFDMWSELAQRIDKVLKVEGHENNHSG